MNNKASRILLPILIVAISIGLMAVLAGSKKPPKQKSEQKKDLLVKVIESHSEPHVYTIPSQGTVQPKIKSNIVAESAGRIIRVSDAFVNGGIVKKGEFLLEIDPADHKTAVKVAKANLARAKATLAEEKARSKVAESEWNSAMKGEAPDLYLRKPQLARELANVQAAEADLEKAERQLSKTKVVALFDGLIKAKAVDLGQFVNRGAVIAEMYGTEVAEIRLPVSDLDLSFMSFNTLFELETQKPEVIFVNQSLDNNVNWRGQIVRSEGIIDNKSRMMYLVAEIKDPYGLYTDKVAIEFGRFVKANIVGRSVEQVTIIPRDVLVNEETLLIAKDNKIVIQPVEVDRLDNRFAYITSGVTDGDQVITTKIKNPIAGTSIRLMDENEQIDTSADKSEQQQDVGVE